MRMLEFKEAARKALRLAELQTVNRTPELTADEQERIANGESYCFRCGKPASSFEAYDTFEDEEKEVPGSRDAYVRREEGTYNPSTNRFACDGCYIAIGMPSSDRGWVAP